MKYLIALNLIAVIIWLRPRISEAIKDWGDNMSCTGVSMRRSDYYGTMAMIAGISVVVGYLVGGLS